MGVENNNGETTGGCTGKGFLPGQTGNRFGRPKTAHFAEEVRDYLNRKDGDKTNLETVLENLKKRRPEILLYFAFGKPIETQVQVKSAEEETEEIALAIARLWAQGKVPRPPEDKSESKDDWH
jgi:hypothetical protein